MCLLLWSLTLSHPPPIPSPSLHQVGRRGRGLFAGEALEAGQLVVEYVGEVSPSFGCVRSSASPVSHLVVSPAPDHLEARGQPAA